MCRVHDFADFEVGNVQIQLSHKQRVRVVLLIQARTTQNTDILLTVLVSFTRPCYGAHRSVVQARTEHVHILGTLDTDQHIHILFFDIE